MTRTLIACCLAAATWQAGMTAAAGPAAPQQAADHHEMHRRHADPTAYMASLEDPARDAYQKPDAVVEALRLQSGQAVADVGAGTGYFSIRLAHAVGERGRVYAVDVSPDMVRHLNRRVRDAGIANVVSVLAPEDDPLLREGSVDLVFICNVWHHIEDQEGYLQHLQRALRPGGRLVMIDFEKRELPVGPPVAMKIAREDLIAQLEKSGWAVAREHDILPYQFFLEFTPR